MAPRPTGCIFRGSFAEAGLRRLTAKFEKIIVDVQAAAIPGKQIPWPYEWFRSSDRAIGRSGILRAV